MTEGPVLTTERLSLRKFTLEDAPFILRLLNEPSFIKNIADRGVRTIEDAGRYLTGGPIASYERYCHGLWLVELKGTRAPIGMCGLIKRDAFPDVDLGYALLPEFWAKGYALEATEATLRYGAEVLRFPRFLAFVTPGNEGSIRVLRKLGFTESGTTRLSPNDVVLLFARGEKASPR